MMMVDEYIRIVKGSIDDIVVEGNPCLRGVIHTGSLQLLRIDHSYQREFLSTTTRRYIMDALANQERLPDLELGMRGVNWGWADGGDMLRGQAHATSSDMLLKDPVFIIDGQQRRGSILEFLTRFPKHDPRQGVVVHFGSTVDWERKRFQALNLHQTRVSTGLIVRNLRQTCPGIACAYGLTQTDRDFPLYDRVGWGQNMGGKDLVTGTGYVMAILTLHGHFGAGIDVAGVRQVAGAFDKLESLIGLAQLRANIQTLFGIIQQCWGLRDLTKRGAVWMRTSFLLALCDVFSDHLDFWAGDKATRFIVPPDLRHRLERFPVTDPEIRSLAGSSGQARTMMAYNFITHIDKGRRGSLRKRNLEQLLSQHRSEASRAARRGRPRGNGEAHPE
jgi:hypothetical protein